MTIRLIHVTCLSALIAACSSGTPRSLVDARAAYQRAAQGPAAQMTPAQLHVARTSLTLAEKTYDDEGDSANARDRAYVAQRKAELAEVQAALVAAEQRAAAAARLAELNKTRHQQSTQQALSQTQAQLAAEQQRRLEAERRTAEAMAQLASVAAVKKETRGTVITLSGSVIFASNKTELLPAARAKLDQVATALKQSEAESKFIVEGHTDSRGPIELNQELSAKRAAAVREYLVSQGVPAERITAVGRGPTQPVADNNTAEGRANNRRVEIIVQGQQQLADQGQAGAGAATQASGGTQQGTGQTGGTQQDTGQATGAQQGARQTGGTQQGTGQTGAQQNTGQATGAQQGAGQTAGAQPRNATSTANQPQSAQPGTTATGNTAAPRGNQQGQSPQQAPKGGGNTAAPSTPKATGGAATAPNR